MVMAPFERMRESVCVCVCVCVRVWACACVFSARMLVHRIPPRVFHLYVDEALDAARALSFAWRCARSSNKVQRAKPVVPRQCEIAHTAREALGYYIHERAYQESDIR